MTICPILSVTGDVSVIINDESYKLKVGEQQLVQLILNQGVNQFTFQGTGSVTIIYRKGSL